MAPTLTDQQLGEEIHEVAENLAGFRVEVAEKFGATNARLEAFRAEIKAELSEKFVATNAQLEALRSELKETLAEKFGSLNTRHETFRSEVETNLKFIRWIGTFFAGILVSIFIGLITLAWHASALNSDVGHMERHLAEVIVEVKSLDARVGKVESRMDGIEQRMDGMSKQLELLIRQTAPKAQGADLTGDRNASSRKSSITE
jgi:DNA repair exonuclease SbcCD ATPase subunit